MCVDKYKYIYIYIYIFIYIYIYIHTRIIIHIHIVSSGNPDRNPGNQDAAEALRLAMRVVLDYVVVYDIVL